MDFTLSKQQQMVQKMYKEFAENEVKPLAKKVDAEEYFPKETVEKMAKLGMMGIYFPKEVGGFAARMGCPPPKIIEALLLKQGGRYPLSCPFTDSKCAEQPQTEIGNSSSGALENGQMSFRLF